MESQCENEENFLSSSSEVRSYSDKIDHLYEQHLTSKRIGILLLSKEEFLVFQKKKIELYKINTNNIIKEYSIQVDSTILDIIIKNNSLIVSTNKNIIILIKDNKNKYVEIKRIKPQKNQLYFSLLNLKEDNLICAFSIPFLKIININTSEIVSAFKFQTNEEGRPINNFYLSDDEKSDKEIILNLEAFDPRQKPFLIGDKKNMICFKLLSYCIILNYKTMKIVQKLDYSKSFSFHLFKTENEYDNFYIILISEYENPKIQVMKYTIENNNKSKSKKNNVLKLVDKFETPFLFPHWNYVEYEQEQEDDFSEKIYCEDECIYKCIIKDVKNFSFIFHRHGGAPSEDDCFFLFLYKNGLKEKIDLGIAQYYYEESKLEYDMIEINNGKFILAKGNECDGIIEVKLENFECKISKKKKTSKKSKKSTKTNKKKEKIQDMNQKEKYLLSSDSESEEKTGKKEKKVRKNSKKNANQNNLLIVIIVF